MPAPDQGHGALRLEPEAAELQRVQDGGAELVGAACWLALHRHGLVGIGVGGCASESASHERRVLLGVDEGCVPLVHLLIVVVVVSSLGSVDLVEVLRRALRSQWSRKRSMGSRFPQRCLGMCVCVCTVLCTVQAVAPFRACSQECVSRDLCPVEHAAFSKCWATYVNSGGPAPSSASTVVQAWGASCSSSGCAALAAHLGREGEDSSRRNALFLMALSLDCLVRRDFLGPG